MWLAQQLQVNHVGNKNFRLCSYTDQSFFTISLTVVWGSGKLANEIKKQPLSSLAFTSLNSLLINGRYVPFSCGLPNGNSTGGGLIRTRDLQVETLRCRPFEYHRCFYPWLAHRVGRLILLRSTQRYHILLGCKIILKWDLIPVNATVGGWKGQWMTSLKHQPNRRLQSLNWVDEARCSKDISSSIAAQFTIKKLWRHCAFVSCMLGIISTVHPPRTNWDCNPPEWLSQMQ